MTVLEERNRYVRALRCVFLDDAMIDRIVAQPLKDESRLPEHRRERVVLEAVVVERVTERAHAAFGEERRLLRPRRRGKPVEIEDVAYRRHRSVWHPRRQRQAMRPSPSVL